MVGWKECGFSCFVLFLAKPWIQIPSLSFKRCIILVKSLKRVLFSHLQNGGGDKRAASQVIERIKEDTVHENT